MGHSAARARPRALEHLPQSLSTQLYARLTLVLLLAMVLMGPFRPPPVTAMQEGGDDADVDGEGQTEEDADDIIALQTELFEEKDADGDGQLDTHEFRAMLLEDVHPDERMGEHEVSAAFRLADLDDDKKVSLQEWMAKFFHGSPQIAHFKDGEEVGSDAGAALPDAEETRLHAREQFDKLDSDGSGYLSESEILSMIRATAAHSPHAATVQDDGDSQSGGPDDGAHEARRDKVSPQLGAQRQVEGMAWGEDDEKDMQILATQMLRDLDIDRDSLIRYELMTRDVDVRCFTAQGARPALKA